MRLLFDWFKFLRSKGYPFFSSLEYAWHNKSRFTIEGEWPYDMRPRHSNGRPRLEDENSQQRLSTTRYEDLCQ